MSDTAFFSSSIPKIQPKDTDVSICQSCIEKTGGCCTNVTFTISEKEIAPFFEKQKSGLPEGHSIVLNDDDDDVKTYNYDSNGEACMFLDADNKCSIYDKRPLICRTYPVNWGIEKKKITFYLDFECVLSHHIPVNTFYKKVADPRIQQQYHELGDMEFDPELARYVDISTLYKVSDPKELLDS